MRIYSKNISFPTREKLELIDLTSEVEKALSDSKVREGLCLVQAPHATAAIMTNESEAGLLQDILKKIDELFPENGRYLHNRIDDNARSHLASAFIGTARAFPVKGGRLVRGTWQNILFLELDGPRAKRSVYVQIIGQ